jgi:Domain of unknown function (DUF4349)
MRLRERFERGRDEPLTPQDERELAAVEAGLAGLELDRDLAELGLLAQSLRDERELPSAQFSAKLDEWAAAGFPREAAPDGVRRGLEGLRKRLVSTPPRRILAPAGAALTMIVVAAVVIGEAGNFGGSSDTVAVQPLPSQASGKDTATPSAGSAGSAHRLERAPVAPSTDAFKAGSGSSLRSLPAIPARQRKIAQNVALALATSPSDFNDAADGVLDVVQTHRGFVQSSDVSGGDPRVKGSELGQARFDLRLPAGQLEAALGDLSDLGHVVSRTDGTRDITHRYVSTKKHIATLEDTRQNLLQQLQSAFTLAEQESIKRRLRIVEDQLNAAENQLGDIQRRVHFVPVAVTISASDAVGAGGGGDGTWSIGDALHDAGRVLEVAAGVLVISAAVLVPVGLVALIALLSARELRRRQREAALD